MRTFARALLLVFAFTIPWEYSLDFDPPYGNIARIVGLALVLATLAAVSCSGSMRAPGPVQWAAAALFLWFCCTALWSADPRETLGNLPGYAQELMIVWLVWELVEDERHLRAVLWAFVTGCSVLAALTVADFLLAADPDKIRFVAAGQDPNDVARYLALGLPFAAMLSLDRRPRLMRLLPAAYIPLCILAVLLTGSRSGFLALLLALAGCAVIVFQTHGRAVIPALMGLPAMIAVCWFLLPQETLARAVSLGGGDLNQRRDIWAAGWHAFAGAPFLGYGAGMFVNAAGLAPEDTAHNTALALVVEDGVIALVIFSVLLACAIVCIMSSKGVLRLSMATALLVLVLCSLVATVHENRLTWLILGLIAVAPHLPERSAAYPEPSLSEAALLPPRMEFD